jgi:hypothetical protein
MRSARTPWALAAFTGLAAAGGCGGASEPLLPPEPHLSSIQSAVFNTTCAFASCHSAADAKGDLVLTPGSSYRQLVGVAATQEAAADEGLVRVVPGDPGASFLLIKLRDPLAAKYEDLMPRDGTPLAPDFVEPIAEWIRRGALDD